MRLKLLTNSVTVSELIEMLKSYESYRNERVNPTYANRFNYIKRLISERSRYLELFSNPWDVRKLVYKQNEAHQKGMTAEPGWQAAMKDAGIWDDDKETF